MLWDYIFIGSGPATLGAITTLGPELQTRILVLEAGESERGRKGCVGLKTAECRQCYGHKCHVLQGVGGACAMYGNKLCHLPASSGVCQFIPSQAGQLPDGTVALPALPTPRHSLTTARTAVTQIAKRYKAKVLHSTDYRARLKPFIERLRQHAEVKTSTEVTEVIHPDDYWAQIEDLMQEVYRFAEVKHGVQVADVRRLADMFEVQVESGESYMARNVVFAVGRSGHAFLRHAMDSLHINYTENCPDVGFRLEVEEGVVSEEFLYQPDPKFKFELPGVGNARTFCTCSGGAIIPVKFGNAVYADGAFLRKGTGKTNVALMARADTPVPTAQLEAWCKRLNKSVGNQLVLAEIPLEGQGGATLAQQIFATIPEWPLPEHAQLMALLLGELVAGHTVEMFKPVRGKRLRVVGPSIDLYWPKVALDKGFETTTRNAWVIGDATGHSRGIVQAFVAGIGWAQHQLALTRQNALPMADQEAC